MVAYNTPGKRDISEISDLYQIEVAWKDDIRMSCQKMDPDLMSYVTMDTHMDAQTQEIKFREKISKPSRKEGHCVRGEPLKCEGYVVNDCFEMYHNSKCFDGFDNFTRRYKIQQEGSDVIGDYKYALNRQKDLDIIDAIFGNIRVVKEGGGVTYVPLSGKNIINQCDQPLLVENAHRLGMQMKTSCGDMGGEQVFVGMAPADMVEMIQYEPRLQSIDTSDSKALQTGMVFNYVGVNFVVLPEDRENCLDGSTEPVLPIFKKPVLNDAGEPTGLYTYVRQLPVWKKGSVHFKMVCPYYSEVINRGEWGKGSFELSLQEGWGVTPVDNCGRGAIFAQISPESLVCYSEEYLACVPDLPIKGKTQSEKQSDGGK